MIKWFNHGKSYGFIHCEDGSEVFVHESAVILGSSELTLAKGRQVEFEVRDTPKGQQAFSVVVVGEDEPDSSPDSPPDDNGADEAPPEPREPAFDFSKKMPNSWKRRPSAFVYSYTIRGRG